MALLSNRIRQLRFRNGEMTQKALAEQVGISRQTMNAIENGRHAPTVSVAIRIADVFSVTVDELFSLDDEREPAPTEPAARPAVDQSRAFIMEPTRATTDQSRTPITEPVRMGSTPDPVSEAADRQVTLADLRNVIGQ